MSTASHDSSVEMGPGPVQLAGSVAGDGSQLAGGGSIWLDGDVLACACPDCGAPMSIRLWLMVADCFRCGASIELSEEQEREALRLLREHEESKRRDSQEAVAAIAPTMLRKPKRRPAAKPAAPGEEAAAAPHPATAPAAAPAVPRYRPRRVAASQVYRGARARIRDLYEKGGVAVFFSEWLKDLPAWLVSAVVHLVIILLLGMWYEKPLDDSGITLATSVGHEDLPGEQGEIDQTMLEGFEFEDPGAVELVADVDDLGAPSESEPELEPPEMAVNVHNPAGVRPDIASRPTTHLPPAPIGRMFAGRDPQARAQAVRQSGGTSFTEAAVARGLKFLSRHQNQDGSWSLHEFHKSPDCDETCTGQGRTRSDVAATALSLLPFLGAGQTHIEGEYTDEVTQGLKWLVEFQKENGDMRDGGQMYAHAQAAIVLSEAYALTGDEQLREPAQLALNFIVRAQHREGGWRYNPGQAGDTSVVGWQLMALKSGQMAYLFVPSKTFEMSGLFLDQVQKDKVGGRYAYLHNGRASPAMTAEALLCRQYLGWPQDHPGLQSGVDYLLENLPDADNPNIYYWYYATQVMHHHGGRPWRKWNARTRQVLVEMQGLRGHAAGSWAPVGRGNQGGFAESGGRIYMTALAICTLEVYYRHMPIYGKEVLEGFE